MLQVILTFLPTAAVPTNSDASCPLFARLSCTQSRVELFDLRVVLMLPAQLSFSLSPIAAPNVSTKRQDPFRNVLSFLPVCSQATREGAMLAKLAIEEMVVSVATLLSRNAVAAYL